MPFLLALTGPTGQTLFLLGESPKKPCTHCLCKPRGRRQHDWMRDNCLHLRSRLRSKGQCGFITHNTSPGPTCFTAANESQSKYFQPDKAIPQNPIIHPTANHTLVLSIRCYGSNPSVQSNPQVLGIGHMNKNSELWYKKPTTCQQATCVLYIISCDNLM